MFFYFVFRKGGENNMKLMSLKYESSIDNIKELNSSFDVGVLRIAYHGLNRNNSFISKEAFENAIPSMFNCPVVTNYKKDVIDENGENGDLGSHDSHIEIRGNEVQFINDTEPIGVVFESANYWWEEVEDESGIHEYLCTDVILWKRQNAYEKIKEVKIFNHSMEINVKTGEFTKEGYYNIEEFEFEAFCILSNSVEPCFESSQIQVFNKLDKEKFQNQWKVLKEDLKNSISDIQMSFNNKGIQNINKNKGGNSVEDKLLLFEKFSNLKEDDVKELKENIDKYSLEELETKLTEMSNKKNEEPTTDFTLSVNQIFNAIDKTLSENKVIGRDWWGDPVEEQLFYSIDLITDEKIVVVIDNSWDNYYGIPYTMNGDVATLDFENKKLYMKGDWREVQDGSMQSTANFSKIKTAYEDKMKVFNEKASQKALEQVKNEFNVTETEEYKTLVSQFEALKENYSKIETNPDEKTIQEIGQLKTDFSNVSIELEDLKEKFSKLSTEKETLQIEKDSLLEFKLAKEKEELTIKVDEVISNFSFEENEIKEIREKAISGQFSLEDFEDKLILMEAKKNRQSFSKKKEESKESTVIRITETNFDDKSVYGEASKYFNK
jgi:hypothetical protein